MNVINTREEAIYLYDPAVSDYETSGFKTISGTPAVAASKLGVNAAEFISTQVFRFGGLEFFLTVPAAPTAGDVRSFGFYNANGGVKGKIEFDITGIVFSAKAYDEDGTLIGSYTIPWSASWTNTAARFRIFYSERNVFFTINNTIVAKFEEVAMSKLPLSIHVKNGNSDAMTISLIAVN